MFCTKCGTQLPDTAKFCGKCGIKITRTEPTDMILNSNDRENSAAPKYGVNGTEIVTSDDEPAAPKYGVNGTEIVVTDPINASGSDDIQTSPEHDQISESVKKKNGIAPLKAGDMVGGIYRVDEIIGHGGFGNVYKAYDTNLQYTVVIKQIYRPDTGLSNRTEADVLKNIKHSYLPKVSNFIEEKGTAYTIMDFVPGSDIEKLMDRGKKFRQKELIKIAIQLCEAVKYLHGCTPPIIHSDIKPNNIMLSEDGNICLIDMNVSHVFDKNPSLIAGTGEFAPPEQIGVPIGEIRKGVSKYTLKKKCTPSINERSDIYSMGASIYYMALKKFPADDYCTDPVADFAAAGISEPLAVIVAKAMAPNPAKRYRSAAEMLTALNNLGKLDRRYKALQIQRTVVTALCAVMAFSFVSISRMGYARMKKEHEEKYQSYVLEIENSMINGDYEKAVEAIALAKAFDSSRIEPYLNEAQLLSDLGDYERCAEYPEKHLTADIFNNTDNSREMLARIYEISAGASFELEQYNDAAIKYQEALRYSPEIIECYRDLTISYARLGNTELAEKSLEKARELGIADDRLDLMQGEISAAKGEFSEAFNSFKSAIQKTTDDYVRFRSLLACDKMVIADGQETSALKMVLLLESELDKVAEEYSGTAREMLANEYARCGELLGSKDYYRKAANSYRELMDEGKLSYQLKKNYFNILFTQLKEYDSCKKLLDVMEQENDLDYWIPMNNAYLEITLQNMISDQNKRNYSAAYNSYLKAEKLYETHKQNGKSDPNMDTLRSSINNLKSFGWL